MYMKRPSFDDDHIYHIYNRGVEKRNIFLDKADYSRFLLSLQEFNNRHPTVNMYRRSPLCEVRLRTILQPVRKPLVSILAYCLMPNHYHLMVQQKAENGITEFMRKLGTGYTNYFNTKNERVGSLFQGKFKAITLEHTSHFIHLPHYIHLNPLDMIEPKWRTGNVKNFSRAMDFVKTYPWSSLQYYLSPAEQSNILERDFLSECIGTPQNFVNQICEWLLRTKIDFVRDYILE